MIDVDSFLAGVAETRRQAQAAARAGGALASGRCDLPPALNLILANGGLIQPQLARSPFAPAAARVGVPTGDRAQVEYWWRLYGEEANWLLDTAASSILVIEFSPYVRPYGLFRRPGESRMFDRTLRFGTPKRLFALFSVPPGRHMSRGCAATSTVGLRS